MRFIVRLMGTLCFGLICLQTAEARRVALVIGNAEYKIGPLANPLNDAAAVAEALERALKFDRVILKRNLGFNDFRAALAELSREAVGADLGAVYFAGHGIEVNGRNFLIPVDATLARASSIDLEAIPLDAVLGQLDGVRKLKLVILDACRNNPFRLAGAKRSVSRGLVRVEPEGHTLIAYAAKDGTTADDGQGRHSPFTEALLKRIATPGLEIRRLFGYVSDDVLAATNRTQEPYLYGRLGGEEIFLHPQPHTGQRPAPAPQLSDAERTWAAVKDSTSIAALKAFRLQYGAAHPVYDRLAEARIVELTRQQTALAMPPAPPAPPPAPIVAPRPKGQALPPATRRGGVLKFVVPHEPPSFDGHRELTFALIHPIAPFYSSLIRINPDNPASHVDFVCDLCTGMPEPADGGRTYAFKIRKDAKFHDGTPVTAADVHATFKRIVFPPQGVLSGRHAQFSMVQSVTTPDADTVVFKLKHASGAFIPALASPYNFVYSKARLDADQHWYEKNVLGSGPFIFQERQAGAFIKGKRNPDYHHKGRPYLDGFEAIFARTHTLRVQAIRGDHAAIEFRGFPPKSRDDLVRALGKDIAVQESDWNCMLLLTPNQEQKPFDDVRVRKALTLAIDRWGGSKDLSKIAIVKAVGGLAFPGHPLAAKKEELEQIIGYWPDLGKSRAEAKRLLKEAGHQNLRFTLVNRGIDQPYTIVGAWLVDQWKQAGIAVDQKIEATGPFYASLRAGKFEVALEFNCQAVVNPLVDVSQFRPDSGAQYGRFRDEELIKLHDAMNRTGDVAAQRRLMRAYEKRVLNDQAHSSIALWWYRIVPHRSYLKGWTITPSHYLNQDLSTVWLDR
jgi:peptide/nickel transport system substrate-binding protein